MSKGKGFVIWATVTLSHRHTRNTQSPKGPGLPEMAKRFRCPASSHRGECPIHTASYLHNTQAPAAHVYFFHIFTVLFLSHTDTLKNTLFNRYCYSPNVSSLFLLLYVLTNKHVCSPPPKQFPHFPALLLYILLSFLMQLFPLYGRRSVGLYYTET